MERALLPEHVRRAGACGASLEAPESTNQRDLQVRSPEIEEETMSEELRAKILLLIAQHEATGSP